jgi:hypothetical protein
MLEGQIGNLPGTSKQQLRIRSVLDVPADTSQRPLRPLRQLLPQRAWDGGEPVVSETRPWANRITRWRANPGSLGKIGHRSETGARVIGEQRARGSPLCRSQFVQSPVDCLGNRSVCSRRSLLRRSLPRRSTTRVHGLHPGTSSRVDTSMSAKSTTVIDSSGNSSQPSSSSPDEENTTAPPTPRRHRIRK